MKKTKLRALLSMGLAAALMVGLVAVTALADDGVPTVTYDHSVKQFQFTNVAAYSDEHGHQYPDLFRDLKNLMPGDAVSQAIKVKVSGTGRGSVNMYLKVEPEGDGISADEKLDYAELLDAEGVTLTFAKIAQTQITSQYDSLQDTPLMQAYMEATGVNIEVIAPADNTLKGARFSFPDVVRLLDGTGIKIE